MPPTSIAEVVAKHDVRLENVEKRQDSFGEELRSLKSWIMATLAAALGGVIVQLVRVIASR